MMMDTLQMVGPMRLMLEDHIDGLNDDELIEILGQIIDELEVV